MLEEKKCILFCFGLLAISQLWWLLSPKYFASHDYISHVWFMYGVYKLIKGLFTSPLADLPWPFDLLLNRVSITWHKIYLDPKILLDLTETTKTKQDNDGVTYSSMLLKANYACSAKIHLLGKWGTKLEPSLDPKQQVVICQACLRKLTLSLINVTCSVVKTKTAM